MKKRNGFTLIELLAVIVILAVILVISIPRILDVIEESKVNTFKSTAQLIADSAEKKYVTNKLNNIEEVITCENVTKLSKEDYKSCTITFDEEGKAKVSITGKGKFDGLVIKNATKNNAVVTELVETDSKYFSYEVQIDGLTDDKSKIYDVTVTDQSKCESYLISEFTSLSQEQAATLCTGGVFNGDALADVVKVGNIPESDYETAGLKVDVYNKNGDVYSKSDNVEVIDQSKCVAYLIKLFNDTNDEAKQGVATLCTGGVVNGNALADAVKVGYIPESDYETAGLKVTTKVYDKKVTVTITGYNIEGGLDVVIPSEIDGKKVVRIADYAFTREGVIPTGISNTKKVSVSYLNNIKNKAIVVPLGTIVIEGLGITSVTIPESVTSIGADAFRNNQLPDEDAFIYKRNSDGSIDNTTIVSYGGKNKSPIIPDSVTSIGSSAFRSNQLTSITIPESVTSIGDGAFEDNQLTSVIIPNSVTSIGQSAFYKTRVSNPNLTKIINKTGKSFSWGSIINQGSGYAFITGTVVNSRAGNVEVVSE